MPQKKEEIMNMHSPYREMMIRAYVEAQIKNYLAEGWPSDEMDAHYKEAHVLDPLRKILSITDAEEAFVRKYIEAELED